MEIIDRPTFKSKLPAFLAWFGTFATAGFSVWGGITGYTRGNAIYSPMIALTAMMVVGLIWYTYYTRGTLEHLRQNQRETALNARSSTCTAMLAELRNLAERTRRLHRFGPSPGAENFFSHPFLTLGASNPSLLAPNTIEMLARVLRRLTDLESLVDMYAGLDREIRENTLNEIGRENRLTDYEEAKSMLKLRAAWTFNSIVSLAPLLQHEGGMMPAVENEPAAAGASEVELLPNPFGETPD